MEMMTVVMEQYWKDVMQKHHGPIWEWFGISQTTWSNYKKKRIPKKHLQKIYDYWQKPHDTRFVEMAELIVKEYHKNM